MAHDALRNTGLTRAVTDLLADLSDLVQKELRLAKAEVTENISARLQAGAWMVAAAALAFIAILLVVEAAVFAVASYGLAPSLSPAGDLSPIGSLLPPEPSNKSPETSRQPRNS
jgi:Putative Actinobacterial Holin-X, holin superfamily III